MISNNFDHVGKTLGPIGPELAKQVPPVGIALDRLEKQLYGLRDTVSTLERRLSVVMRPVPVCEQGKQAGLCAGGSPLVQQIEDMTNIVRFTDIAVLALIDCLEI